MRDEAEYLRKGIQDYLDGNYISPRDRRALGPQDRCAHGMFYWDACESCIDEHFTKLLAGALSYRSITEDKETPLK